MANSSEKPVDEECGDQAHTQQNATTDQVMNDGEVTWDGPDDPADPYNWPSSRKISVGIICSASQLVTTMSASMIAPAMDRLLADLSMSPATGQIALSVFFLGLGFAPFIVAPLAEMYGRKPLWLAGNMFYILWNALAPVGFSPGLMIVARLLSASGASVGVTLTGPVLADMYRAKDRGMSLAIAGILPYIGPALGPIVGGLASQRLWWPWLFWILSIFDALILVLGVFIIRETYAPVLLSRKAKRIAKSSAEEMPSETARSTLWERVGRSWNDFSKRIGTAVQKPFRLLAFRPIIQILSVSLSFSFGVYTLVLSTFASLYQTRYNQSPTTASLHYIAIAIGAFICAQAGGRLMDFIWLRMKAARPDREPTPEYRLPYIVVGLVPGVAGLFWYAWAAEETVHWAVVDVGVCFFTCGSFMFSQGLLAYLLDEFPSSTSASANAASRVGSYVFGFAFPIFAPDMYETLGIGWGNSLLAILFAILGVSTVVVLWVWGEKLRAKGRTAEDEKVVVE